MKMLGVEWQHGTSGQEESASKAEFVRSGNPTIERTQAEGKRGEKTTATIDGQLKIASGLR